MNIAAKADATSRDGWEANGWLLIPEFLGADELTELRREADRLWADQGLFLGRGAVPNSPTRSDRLDPVIDLSPAFATLAANPRLLAAIDGVLGGKAQLMKDKYIAKPAGAGGYDAHQDGAYWPGMGLNVGRFLTAILFLDDATAENGAIECAPGHHRRLLTAPDTIADPDEAALGRFALIEAKAGDLLLLHALTPHRSGANQSEGMRRALLYTYGIDERPGLYARYKQFQQEIRN